MSSIIVICNKNTCTMIQNLHREHTPNPTHPLTLPVSHGILSTNIANDMSFQLYDAHRLVNQPDSSLFSVTPFQSRVDVTLHVSIIPRSHTSHHYNCTFLTMYLDCIWRGGGGEGEYGQIVVCANITMSM